MKSILAMLALLVPAAEWPCPATTTKASEKNKIN
jgi:hypothetical protein